MVSRFLGAFVLWVWMAGFVVPAGAQQSDNSPPSTDWKIKSKTGLHLQQSHFSEAWSGDEVGTVSWSWTWNSEATKQLSPWANWLNTLVTQFGQTHQQTEDRSRWEKPSKSADKISYRGIVRFTAFETVDPFVAFDIDSQFFQQLEDSNLTRVLTPSTLRPSVGIAKVLRDTERQRLITRIGFAGKIRIDRLAIDSQTMELGTETTSEGGLESFTQGRWAAPEDKTVFTSELRLFKALAISATDPAARNHWTTWDFDWQNTLSSKVTSFIEFVLFWQFVYDKQIDVRGQFKQTLGVGFTWQLK